MRKLVIPKKEFNHSIRGACSQGQKFLKSFINDYVNDAGDVAITKTQAKQILKQFIDFYDKSRRLQEYSLAVHVRVFLNDLLSITETYYSSYSSSYAKSDDASEVINEFFNFIKKI